MSVELSRIDEISSMVSRSTQTITHFGFGEEELHRLAGALVGRGGYRIVPVGEALNFEQIWDGVDLFRHATRVIVCR